MIESKYKEDTETWQSNEKNSSRINEEVYSFANLGKTLRNGNNQSDEINRHKSVRKKTKFTLYKTLIWAVLYWDNEMYRMKQIREQKIYVFEYRALRRILNLWG